MESIKNNTALLRSQKIAYLSERSFDETQDPTCPFITKRHEDCYSTRLNSQTIPATLFYCGRSYEECSIYKKISMEETVSHENRK